MNWLLATRLLGWLLMFLAAFQLVPIAAAITFGESVVPYVVSAVVAAAIGIPVGLLVRPTTWRVRPRDGFGIVSGAWILASLFGALPYLTTGTLTQRPRGTIAVRSRIWVRSPYRHTSRLHS